MPPFGADGEKAVFSHGFLKQGAVGHYIGWQVGSGGVGFLAEEIVGGAHVKFLAGVEADDGEVCGGAAAVETAAFGVGDVARVRQNIPEALLVRTGTVAVVHFEAQVLRFQILVHF